MTHSTGGWQWRSIALRKSRGTQRRGRDREEATARLGVRFERGNGAGGLLVNMRPRRDTGGRDRRGVASAAPPRVAAGSCRPW